MEATVGVYDKGNGIISWRSLCVGSCLVLSGNCCCMRYYRQSILHQICISWIGNDNVHQGSKTISGANNIHSSLFVVGEKVSNFSLYVNSIL